MKQLKRKSNQLLEIIHFQLSRQVNSHVVIEQRIAHFYHDRQLQRIRQLF
ncbi:hypothetical protein [Amphibacillus indicireducens]